MTKGKKKPFATIDNLKAGDTIWVSSQSYFDNDFRIEEVKVCKVNKSSFYTKILEGRDTEARYDMKTGNRQTLKMGSLIRTWRTKEECIESFRLEEEKKKLKSELKERIGNLSLNDLKALNTFLEEL